LATHEAGVLAAVRAVLPALLGAVVQQSTTALAPAQQRQREQCPRCGARREARHQWRRRTVQTSCGPLGYERPRYRCRPCQQEWSPADHVLGVAPRARISALLDDWLAEVGAERPFGPAAALLERLTGLQVSAETVRRHSEQRGAALEVAQQAAIQRVHATGEVAEAVDTAPGTLLVETDGVMVRYRQTGWHEVKKPPCLARAYSLKRPAAAPWTWRTGRGSALGLGWRCCGRW
jgi:transposase